MKNKPISSARAGFLQALGVVVYVSLVGTLMRSLENSSFEPPEQFAIFFVLTLLVFSASITGALVFGYPAYLGLNKKIREALHVFGWTLGFLFLFLILLFCVISIL